MRTKIYPCFQNVKIIKTEWIIEIFFGDALCKIIICYRGYDLVFYIQLAS